MSNYPRTSLSELGHFIWGILSKVIFPSIGYYPRYLFYRVYLLPYFLSHHKYAHFNFIYRWNLKGFRLNQVSVFEPVSREDAMELINAFTEKYKLDPPNISQNPADNRPNLICEFARKGKSIGLVIRYFVLTPKEGEI